jgi:uncharacterized protein DUF6869
METFDAWEDLDEMVNERPEQAWRLIRDMVDIAPDHLLSVIAAGPLESLLKRYGKKFVARMKKAAATDSQFQRCLRRVWLFKPEWLAREVNDAMASQSKPRPSAGRITKKRARFIARYFHHCDTLWAPSRLDELMRTDIDAAWRILLLLIQIANEEKPHALKAIDVHAFSKLINVRGPEVHERVVDEAGRNATIKSWIEERRKWKYLDENWKGLLARYDGAASPLS